MRTLLLHPSRDLSVVTLFLPYSPRRFGDSVTVCLDERRCFRLRFHPQIIAVILRDFISHTDHSVHSYGEHRRSGYG